MRNKVLQIGSNFYIVPSHEFYVHWLPKLPKYEMSNDGIFLLSKFPNDVNPELIRQACKRGKGYLRMKRAYEQKGSGKHSTYKE